MTGQIGFISETEAKRLLKIYEGRRAAGEVPEQIWQRALTQPATAPTRTPLSALYDRYRLSLVASGAAPATVESADYAWRAWAAALEDTDAAELTAARIDGVIVGWRTDRSDRTIQIRVLLLKRVLALAVEENRIVAAPRLRVPSVRERRPHRWLDPEEQVRLLEALPWATSPASAWAIWLCLQLGLRIGEATSRRWSDIDWGRAQLRVDADGQGWHTKTRKGRWLPLSSAVLERLREGFEAAGREETALLCPVEDIRVALLKACERAGVPAMNPHALRHSWASRLATAGVDRPTLMALGGWTSGELLDEVYAHAHTSHIRDQVERTTLTAPKPLAGDAIPGAVTQILLPSQESGGHSGPEPARRETPAPRRETPAPASPPPSGLERLPPVTQDPSFGPVVVVRRRRENIRTEGQDSPASAEAGEDGRRRVTQNPLPKQSSVVRGEREK